MYAYVGGDPVNFTDPTGMMQHPDVGGPVVATTRSPRLLVGFFSWIWVGNIDGGGTGGSGVIDLNTDRDNTGGNGDTSHGDECDDVINSLDLNKFDEYSQRNLDNILSAPRRIRFAQFLLGAYGILSSVGGTRANTGLNIPETVIVPNSPLNSDLPGIGQSIMTIDIIRRRYIRQSIEFAALNYASPNTDQEKYLGKFWEGLRECLYD